MQFTRVLAITINSMQRFRSEVRIFCYGLRTELGRNTRGGNAIPMVVQAESPSSRSLEAVCDLAPDPAGNRMGLAEISSLDLFKCGATTTCLIVARPVMLLGSALTGLAWPVTKIPTLAASVHKLLFASDHCALGAVWRPRQ